MQGMKPFNIKIGYGANQVTLTILPTADNHFKVIYYAAILGTVRLDIDSWELVDNEKLEAGDLPYYQHDVNSGRINIILNEATVDEIGEEIQNVLQMEEGQ